MNCACSLRECIIFPRNNNNSRLLCKNRSILKSQYDVISVAEYIFYLYFCEEITLYCEYERNRKYH